MPVMEQETFQLLHLINCIKYYCSYKVDIWYYLFLMIIKNITMDILYSFQRAQKCQGNLDTEKWFKLS